MCALYMCVLFDVPWHLCMCDLQGMGVTFIATRLGWTPEDSEAMQNWLICVEMLFAAVGMLFAFPHTEYQLGGRATPGFKWEAFKHAISISDVLEDIYLQVRYFVCVCVCVCVCVYTRKHL